MVGKNHLPKENIKVTFRTLKQVKANLETALKDWPAVQEV